MKIGIIFDLDGTLLDSLADLHHAVNHTLVQHGCPERSVDEIRRFLGEGAKLLIAADCTAYAYARFHEDFIRGKVTLVGCPKLDGVDYSEKLTQIIQNNDIQSVTVVRMVVPCCGGLEFAVKKALQQSGKFIPWQVVTVGIDGSISD